MTTPSHSQQTSEDSLNLQIRLFLMMFLEYLPLGFWTVPLGTYIGRHTGEAGLQIFDASFMGTVGMTAAVSSIFAPLLITTIADRYFSAERILAVLHFLCAIFLWRVAASDSQMMFVCMMIGYYHCFMPTMPLTNAFTFHHLPGEIYPRIRVGGSVSWIISGVVVGYFWNYCFGSSIEHTTTPMLLGVVGHLVMAVYSLTLPHTPPLKKNEPITVRELFHLDSLALLKKPPFAILMFCLFLMATPIQFFINFLNKFMNQIGIENSAAKLSGNQVSEFIGVIAIPFLFRRIGAKRLIAIGLFVWAARFALLSVGSSTGLGLCAIYLSIALHGAGFPFVYITASLYADQLSTEKTRNSVQGLLTIIVSGIGPLIGAALAGYWQMTYLTPPNISPAPYDWATFWKIPAVISFGVSLFFVFAFFNQAASKNKKDTGETEEKRSDEVT